MSTKLHHGFRFRTSDLLEIHTLVQGFRARLEPLVHERLARLIAAEAVRVFDRATDGLPTGKPSRDILGAESLSAREMVQLHEAVAVRSETLPEFGGGDSVAVAREISRLYPPTVVQGDEPSSPLVSAWFRVSDRIRDIQQTQRRDPEVDLSFAIAVIPHDGKVYGLLFTEDREFTSLWFAEDQVEPYPYWNNTDPPKEISWEAWEERGREWDAVLGMDGSGGYAAPALRGFTAMCVTGFPHFPTPEEVLAFLPSFEDRVRHQAKDRVFSRKYNEIVDRDHAGVIPERGAFQIAFQVFDFLKTDKGQAALGAEEERLRGVLVPEITRDHLLPERK